MTTTNALWKTGPLSLDELKALADADPAEMVLLAVPDMQGRLQGKRIPARHFVDHVAVDGADYCGYLLATDVDMRPLDRFDHASRASGYGDMRIVPDLATIRRLARPGAGVLVLADTADDTGAAVEIAPRTVLRRQLRLLHTDHALTARTGLEAEFTLYCGGRLAAADRPQPVTSRNLDYHLHHPLRIRGFLHDLEEALVGSGLPLEATKTEADPGQVEVTFRYGDPLTAADHHLILTHLARDIGEDTEITPVFMAAPQTGTGTGLHIHLSLWDGDTPVLASDDGALLPTGQHALAGLTETLPDLLPLLLPNVNSYKRLRPHSFAPTHMTWGWDDRTCAIRVTGHGTGRHLEIRLPGADANPYLATAAVIAAIRHGIGKHLTPPPPVNDDAYSLADAPPLPHTLDTALSAFISSKTAAELLGTEVVDHYATAAAYEIHAMNTEVTDIERRRGGFAQP